MVRVGQVAQPLANIVVRERFVIVFRGFLNHFFFPRCPISGWESCKSRRQASVLGKDEWRVTWIQAREDDGIAASTHASDVRPAQPVWNIFAPAGRRRPGQRQIRTKLCRRPAPTQRKPATSPARPPPRRRRRRRAPSLPFEYRWWAGGERERVCARARRVWPVEVRVRVWLLVRANDRVLCSSDEPAIIVYSNI